MSRLKKQERQKQLQEKLNITPFLTDEELATHFNVSVPTIRLDRLELGIPELRERIRVMATGQSQETVEHVPYEVVGELIDVTEGQQALSMLRTTSDMEDRFGYVEPQYLYAQANSLAKVVMGTTVCSAEVGNIKYKNPVGAGTNLVAKAEIVRRRGNKFFIWVIIRDKIKEVFMKKLLAMMALSVGLMVNAQTVDLLKPSKEIALRAPSVPIVVSDPYFSIWSPYDNLMEGSTEHWTNAKKPLLGALRVDGKVYRFLGKDKINLIPIAPMTNVERWEAAYTNNQPANGWQELQFDDSNWKKGKAAFGSRDMQRVHTEWKGDNTDIYIRRTFDFNDKDIAEDIYLIYSHDDVFELYLNGEKLVSTGLVWRDNVSLKLSDAAKKKLRNGKNVIAAHCHNTTGGSYVDFGLFREKENAVKFANEAVQKSVDVLATSSYYTFACGPVELDIVFTAPQLIDDLDLLSTPINYVSYRVRSLDKKEHDVQFYIETTPELTINESNQPTIARTLSKNGISYVEAGSIDQPICDRKGDLICADWGYVYLGSVNGAGKSISLGDYSGMKEAFVKNGTLASSKTKWITRREENTPAMAYVHNFGTVTKDGKDGFLMIGYDDIYSIEYMYEKRMGYWKHDGKVTIFDAFEKLRDNYLSIMERCRALDELIYNDAEKAGGKKYAEICSVSYRQVMSAHKLFTDKEGNLLWFSKENNSNGCVNTVDLTYPSAPLFLVYNPELVKAMMTSIFEYSASGRWNKPFAAHDLGTYPIANGQVYGGDMPIEESGNMVILAAALAKVEGNADYAKKYWDILTIWTNYLVEYGQGPE